MLETNSGAPSRFKKIQGNSKKTEEIPFHKREKYILSKEQVAFSYADMSIFSLNFIRKDILYRAYAKIFPSQIISDNADNYHKINEYFFRKFYNRFDGYFFVNKLKEYCVSDSFYIVI